jgi:hypothetical protein
MKAYAFIFAKTHVANCQRKSSSLLNYESKNFYFTLLVKLHFSYNFFACPEILLLPLKFLYALLLLLFP